MKKLPKYQGFHKKVLKRITAGHVSLKYLFIDLALIIVIITISYNVFVAYTEGVANLERLKDEEVKLAKLQEENQALSEKENYYRSIEFRKAYARESLNLSGEGETLYYVVREEDQPEPIEEQNLFNMDSLENRQLWSLLLFGE